MNSPIDVAIKPEVTRGTGAAELMAVTSMNSIPASVR